MKQRTHAMKACICRNISDTTVRKTLAERFKGMMIILKRRGDTEDRTQQPVNLDDLHEACSEGQGFNCGKCACEMARMAEEHNRTVRLTEMKENMPVSLPSVLSETPEKATSAPKTEPV